MDTRALLIESFHAAVGAADAKIILPPHLPQAPQGKTLVAGAGKAAAAMALAVEQQWPSAAPLSGLAITRYRESKYGAKLERAKPKTAIDEVQALLRLDPKFIRLNDARTGLQELARNAPNNTRAWQNLAAQFTEKRVAAVTADKSLEQGPVRAAVNKNRTGFRAVYREPRSTDDKVAASVGVKVPGS